MQDGYHPLLPPTPGLWSFSAPTPTSRANARRHANDLRRAAAARAKPEPEFSDPGCVREAFLAFMDSPHPLEILAGPAYGVDGSISRYHNPDHYKRALGTVYAARRSALERRFSHGETRQGSGGSQRCRGCNGACVTLLLPPLSQT